MNNIYGVSYTVRLTGYVYMYGRILQGGGCYIYYVTGTPEGAGGAVGKCGTGRCLGRRQPDRAEACGKSALPVPSCDREP